MQFLFFATEKIIVKKDFPMTEIKMYLDLVGTGKGYQQPPTRIFKDSHHWLCKQVQVQDELVLS